MLPQDGRHQSLRNGPGAARAPGADGAPRAERAEGGGGQRVRGDQALLLAGRARRAAAALGVLGPGREGQALQGGQRVGGDGGAAATPAAAALVVVVFATVFRTGTAGGNTQQDQSAVIL